MRCNSLSQRIVHDCGDLDLLHPGAMRRKLLEGLYPAPPERRRPLVGVQF